MCGLLEGGSPAGCIIRYVYDRIRLASGELQQWNTHDLARPWTRWLTVKCLSIHVHHTNRVVEVSYCRRAAAHLPGSTKHSSIASTVWLRDVQVVTGLHQRMSSLCR